MSPARSKNTHPGTKFTQELSLCTAHGRAKAGWPLPGFTVTRRTGLTRAPRCLPIRGNVVADLVLNWRSPAVNNGPASRPPCTWLSQRSQEVWGLGAPGTAWGCLSGQVAVVEMLCRARRSFPLQL